jgi:hypothetical protein
MQRGKVAKVAKRKEMLYIPASLRLGGEDFLLPASLRLGASA